MSRKGKFALTALGAAAAVVLGGAAPAMAAAPQPHQVTPQLCVSPAGPYTQTSQTGIHISQGAYRAYGQGGGTITVSKGKTVTLSGTLQSTVSADAGVIFAKVSASVGVSVGLSKAVTATSSYSYAVPAGVSQGWVEMGSHGYQIHWEKGHYASPCTWIVDSSGNLSGTTDQVDFTHS